MQGKIAQHGANTAALATRKIILHRYAGTFPRLRWPKIQQMTLNSQARAWLANQWTRIRFFGKASQTKISCDRQQQISTANHQASQMETKKCKMQNCGCCLSNHKRSPPHGMVRRLIQTLHTHTPTLTPNLCRNTPQIAHPIWNQSTSSICQQPCETVSIC